MSRAKVKYTLAVLLTDSSTTEHGWRYATIDVPPGECYPDRDDRQIPAGKPVTVLYEWSPAGSVEVACRDTPAPDA